MNPMRRTCNPSLVESGQHHLLRRVNYSDRRVAEDFLQSALDKSPQILPVDELDPSLAPLVSLGREIASINNLFISPNDRITVVETKLWRNPEAAREVVGQILDYATRLTSWSYSEFEMEIRKGIQPISMGSDRLYEYIAKKHPSEILPESQFVDEVQRNLREGRFLLLVVGDGIRENIERMIGQLQRYPQMFFAFGLVEIQIYEDPYLFKGEAFIAYACSPHDGGSACSRSGTHDGAGSGLSEDRGSCCREIVARPKDIIGGGIFRRGKRSICA